MRVSASTVGLDPETASWPEPGRDAIPTAPGFGSTLEETVRAARGWPTDPGDAEGGEGDAARDGSSPSEEDLLADLLLIPGGPVQGFVLAGDPSIADDPGLDEKQAVGGMPRDLGGMLRAGISEALAGQNGRGAAVAGTDPSTSQRAEDGVAAAHPGTGSGAAMGSRDALFRPSDLEGVLERNPASAARVPGGVTAFDPTEPPGAPSASGAPADLRADGAVSSEITGEPAGSPDAAGDTGNRLGANATGAQARGNALLASQRGSTAGASRRGEPAENGAGPSIGDEHLRDFDQKQGTLDVTRNDPGHLDEQRAAPGAGAGSGSGTADTESLTTRPVLRGRGLAAGTTPADAVASDGDGAAGPIPNVTSGANATAAAWNARAARPSSLPSRASAPSDELAASVRRPLAGVTGAADEPSPEAIDGDGSAVPATRIEPTSAPWSEGLEVQAEAGGGPGGELADERGSGAHGRDRAEIAAAASSRRNARRADAEADASAGSAERTESTVAATRSAATLLRREIEPPLARQPLGGAEPAIASTSETGAAAGAANSAEAPSARPTLAASLLPESRGHLPSWVDRIGRALEREGFPARTELRIALDPEGLGRLDIRLRLQDGVLHAQVVADHEHTRGLLMQQQHVLEAALSKNDLRLLQLDVGLRGDGQARQSPFEEREAPLGWPREGEPAREAATIVPPANRPSRGRLSVHA